MAATKAEMLEAVNNAINTRLNGGLAQSYSIDGRNVQYITLKELMDLRSKLQNEINSGKDTRNYVSFRRPL